MYLASIYTYLLGALMNDALSVGVPGHAPGGVAAGHVETLHTMPHERDSFTQGTSISWPRDMLLSHENIRPAVSRQCVDRKHWTLWKV